MARPLQERSSSEPGGSIHTEAGRTFPPQVVNSSSSTICEPMTALTHRTAVNRNSRATSHQRSSVRITRCRTRHQAHHDCNESRTSSSSYGQTYCYYPQSFSTAETTYAIRQSPRHVYSRMELDFLSAAHAGLAEEAVSGAQEEELEREIANRLRRIGDQMNELYLQRRLVGERQWWRPLRWHLTQFISEILAALYNPLVDILPHN